ncbi:hypothetical protein PQX77_015192, partial [Marasmius sp. AFHP31]
FRDDKRTNFSYSCQRGGYNEFYHLVVASSSRVELNRRVLASFIEQAWLRFADPATPPSDTHIRRKLGGQCLAPLVDRGLLTMLGGVE